jgi:hypothetical protein
MLKRSFQLRGRRLGYERDAKVVLNALHRQPGIPAGNSFEITLGWAKGNCPLWPRAWISPQLPNVPEPASWALVATGLGVLVTQRKRV